VWRGPRPINRSFVIDRLLRYLFIFPLGLQGLWAFVGHTVFSEDAAREIGWADTPFQYEVGVANLGLAFASLYAGHARTRGRAQGRALSKVSARTERGLAQIYFAGAASAISAMTGR